MALKMKRLMMAILLLIQGIGSFAVHTCYADENCNIVSVPTPAECLGNGGFTPTQACIDLMSRLQNEAKKQCEQRNKQQSVETFMQLMDSFTEVQKMVLLGFYKDYVEGEPQDRFSPEWFVYWKPLVDRVNEMILKSKERPSNFRPVKPDETSTLVVVNKVLQWFFLFYPTVSKQKVKDCLQTQALSTCLSDGVAAASKISK